MENVLVGQIHRVKRNKVADAVIKACLKLEKIIDSSLSKVYCDLSCKHSLSKELTLVVSKMRTVSHNILKIRVKITVYYMATWKRWIPASLYSFHGAAGYSQGHLLASFCYPPVSQHARYVEITSPFRALLAHRHTRALPRTENFERACPLDTEFDHGVALSPRAQGDLLVCTSVGRVVGAGSLHHLATAQGWNALSRGRWQCETLAGDTESRPKGVQSEHQPGF